MKRILVVDDNKNLRDIISLFLSCELPECAVLTGNNGLQAIEIMKSAPVDFILTDLNMPEVSGYQLIEYVKNNLPSTPVLVMTAVCTPNVEKRLYELGVSCCLEKPFNLNDALYRISAALELPVHASVA